MLERYKTKGLRCRCGATGVRLYRIIESFDGGYQARCGRCAGPMRPGTRDQRGTDFVYLPLVISATGSVWAYYSVPDEDANAWRALPDNGE